MANYTDEQSFTVNSRHPKFTEVFERPNIKPADIKRAQIRRDIEDLTEQRRIEREHSLDYLLDDNDD